MELFAAVRRDRRVEDLSIRELAEKYRVHRRTVRQALTSAPHRRVELVTVTAPVSTATGSETAKDPSRFSAALKIGT